MAFGILGEEELEQGASGGSFWDSLGSASKTLLTVGSQIYGMETAKDIEQIRLETARTVQPSGSAVLQPSVPTMVAPVSKPFPVLPVAIGAGALGILFLVLSKKKGRR